MQLMGLIVVAVGFLRTILSYFNIAVRLLVPNVNLILGSSMRIIDKFRDKGYDITVQFVFVGSANECIARIRGRVQRGGHHVPDGDVRRRFTRAIDNFWNRYRVEADRWTLYYNGAGGLVRVAFGERAEAVEPDEFRRFAALREA